MPFGISSAPKEFQQKIYEPKEGMSGNEVVTDDLIAIAYGDTFEKEPQDHDKNLLPFLKRCKLNVRLNLEKIKLRQSQILLQTRVTDSKKTIFCCKNNMKIL